MAGPMLWLPSEDEEGIAVRSGRQVVGRGQEVGIDIHIPAEDVSNRHLELRWHEEILTVVDLASVSGTTVNGAPISEPTVLLDGDEIGLGSVTISVEIPGQFGFVDPVARQGPDSAAPSGGRRQKSSREGERGRVFIIRHHRDGALASCMHRALSRAGWTPWLADAEILGGTGWAAQTVAGLEASDAVVVLLTGQASTSEWVERQVTKAVSAGLPILVAVVGGARPGGKLQVLLEGQPRVELASAAADLAPVETVLRHLAGPNAAANRAARRRQIGTVLVVAGAVGVVVAFAILLAAGRSGSGGERAGPPAGVTLGLPADADEAGPAPTEAPDDDDGAGQTLPRGADTALPVLAGSVVLGSLGEALRRGVWFTRP